jgi:hypothetical protein
MHSISPAEILLGCLSEVRRSGAGWRADCPNGHRSRGALALSEESDGRLLVHCHAGCSVLEVLAAVGLSPSALFPKRPAKSNTSEMRAAARMRFRQVAVDAALGVLAREAAVVELAGSQIARGESLTAEDLRRLHIAIVRIHDVREVLQ